MKLAIRPQIRMEMGFLPFGASRSTKSFCFEGVGINIANVKGIRISFAWSRNYGLKMKCGCWSLGRPCSTRRSVWYESAPRRET